MMANVTTNAGRKVNEQIARYLDNPIGSSRRVSAVREVDAPMAKAKKKARSAAQKAATARMLAAAAQRRGEENEELEENPKMAKKKAKKKTAKSRTKKKTAKARKKTTKRAAAKKTGKSSRKKSKAKRKRKPAVKWGMPAIAAAAAPKPKKRRKKKSKARAASKSKSRSKPRKKSRAKTKRTTGKSHTITLKGAPKVQYVEVVEKKRPKKRRKKALLENPAAQLALLENSQSVGVFGGLFENPAGPFTKDSLMSFGWAAAGTALGFTVARLTDRGVATRKPGKSKDGTEGKHAWFGRDAAAMINRRPDAMRLGVQGVGALGAMVAAYAARNVRVLPWALGGVALGFGSNLLVLVLEWMVLPKIFKVDPKDPKTATEGLGGWGNRYLPMEQDYVQDDIDKQLEDWAALANLKAAQTGEKPSAASPLALPANMYTLGESPGGTPGPLSEAVGGLIPTGRVGDCTSCGGSGGCHSGCPEIQNCGPCSEGASGRDDGGRNCEYTVQEGDDLIALLDATGISANDISSLNDGREAQEIWQAGNTVVLPYAACVEVVRRLPPPLRERIPEISRKPDQPDQPERPEQPYEPPPPPPPPPPVLTREPRPDRPVVTREPQPDRPVFTRANVPLPKNPVFTRANLPSSSMSTVVAGPPDNDAERERRLRGIGRDDE